jgi:stage III sporulation protein AA
MKQGATEEAIPELTGGLVNEGLIVDDLGEILQVLPPPVRDCLLQFEQLNDLIEVVLDLGRPPEARFPHQFFYLSEDLVTLSDLTYVVEHIGRFGPDHRAGIQRTLHRISSLVNRSEEVIGLTCRVGRAVFGTVEILRDVAESGQSILILGPPGVGKTTLLREMARVLADELKKRVIVVDTSNEIAGDGDIPHPAIGHARRMQVPRPEMQHEVMIEAVENHMPEVIIIDEIGRELEAMAARTIAERGVQLVATAHGNTLENLAQNPTLSDLIGGIQAVTLSDEEARYRGTQKTVLERRAPPTFDILVEMKDRETVAIHKNVAETVDSMLRNVLPRPEIRSRSPERARDLQETIDRAHQKSEEIGEEEEAEILRKTGPIQIYPFAISRSRIERGIQDLGLPITVTRNLNDAQVVVTVKSQEKRQPYLLAQAQGRNIPVYVLRNNTSGQIRAFLRRLYGMPDREWDFKLMERTEEMIMKAVRGRQPVDLPAEAPQIRRLQHQMAEHYGMRSESRGEEPNRHVVILPAESEP